MRIVLVAGLPGSGKMTLLERMEREGAVVVDDIVDLRQLPTGNVDLLVVADVSFCRTATREAAERHVRHRFPDASVEWVFLANDPEACLANAEARNDGRNVAPDVAVLSRTYAVPEGAVALSVHGSRRALPDAALSGRACPDIPAEMATDLPSQ